MLLGIVVAWLVMNAVIVAFLLLHPLRHFSAPAHRPTRRAPRADVASPQRNMR